ncbi:unnamed protein product [Moneuplotes crassus]|uniref:Uncharacterized protein n=1 Tax=Euplotes crassus TaxID=5936 RepID=A0AAD2D702_EUPCR|nr:unnamed protein product [Moneuplotes crassus]
MSASYEEDKFNENNKICDEPSKTYINNNIMIIGVNNGVAGANYGGNQRNEMFTRLRELEPRRSRARFFEPQSNRRGRSVHTQTRKKRTKMVRRKKASSRKKRSGQKKGASARHLFSQGPSSRYEDYAFHTFQAEQCAFFLAIKGKLPAHKFAELSSCADDIRHGVIAGP